MGSFASDSYDLIANDDYGGGALGPDQYRSVGRALVACGPHAYAKLADEALEAGNIVDAEELIEMAFLAYDTA
jgi:hypothetical protein